MLLHISSYNLVYLAAGVVTAVAATLVWKRRSVPGGMWLFLLLLARLLDYLNIHNLQEDQLYQLSISAGVTRFDPAVPCTLDELLERGDKAMYEQKQASRRRLSNHLD
jgi:GGDEF domain-containing protein